MSEYNGTMFQYFHWYTPADGKLWKQLEKDASALAKAGFTSIWLPPAYKGAGGKDDVGYGVYDLFDLGEFDQKGSVRTKYGTRNEYLKAIEAAHKAKLQVYADIVFNHKLGADDLEEFKATPYNPSDRNEQVGELQSIKGATHFSFPGRDKKYSGMEWHWWHFTAADYNALDEEANVVYLFEGKEFVKNVDQERGNFDYLIGCDLDVNHEDVQKELFYWGEWYLETTNIDGFRFDAVKHVDSTFFLNWLNHIRAHSGRDLFAVGEYWSDKLEALKHFIEVTEGKIMLFDAGLHYNFATASQEGKAFDMRQIFDNTLVAEHPELAVTLVSNHDTQPLQSLESVVEDWFKPLAYAIILLRKNGYPCVFAADYYGAEYTDVGKDGEEHEIQLASHQWIIDKFLHIRRAFSYGEQYDYFDDANCVGWTRTGDQDHPGGVAVVMSNDGDGRKHMETSSPNTGYVDLTEHIGETVTTNDEGWGEFPCNAGSVSVWVPK